MSSVTFEHGVLPDAVNVNVTLPNAISEADGVYIGVRLLEDEKVPVPELVHKIEE